MSSGVTVFIPTLNESDSIGQVVSDIVAQGYEAVVIDGDSEDNTREIARDNGADVYVQSESGGKGLAMKEVIEDISESEIIVFIDGDKTYESDHIGRLVKPIENQGYDHVIGNRFAGMEEGAMEPLHIFGNRCINIVFRVLYGQNVVDILTGFRAIKRDSFENMEIKSSGFDIETELTAYSVRNGHEIAVVDTAYYEREGESKLQSFRDGFVIGNRLVECRLRDI